MARTSAPPRPFEKPLADVRIGQALLLLDRQVRHPAGELGGEEPTADRRRRSVGRRMHGDIEPAAARRPRLQDVAIEPEALEVADTRGRVALHRLRQVFSRSLDDEARMIRVTGQADRVARDTETELDFRADRHPLDGWAEDVGQQRVALVAAVPSDVLAEQARGHAEPELLHAMVWCHVVNANPVTGIEEGAAVRVEDGVATVVGGTRVTLFRRGAPPEWFRTGERLPL